MNNFIDKNIPSEKTVTHYDVFNYWKDKCVDKYGNVYTEGTTNYDTTVAVVEDWVRDYMSYNQDNPYHSCTLGQHSNLCGEKLKENAVLYYAGLLHDCGKPFTKSFVNSKGEETIVAHYYQHHCCGSYDSLFFNYPSHINRIDVSILINLHMLPYFWEHDEKYGEKTMLKYRKLWGEALFEKVMMLHEADKMSH